jgi:hypothetical protein
MNNDEINNVPPVLNKPPCCKKPLVRVFNFSGGKTSAYMVIRYYQPGDIVLFCDTGREHPKTYKFINDFEAFENIPVTRIAHEGGFEDVLKKRQGLPNKLMRICTIELKVRTARRYLVSLGLKEYTHFIGFRADEPKRVHSHKNFWKRGVSFNFPLFDDGIDKPMINEFWKYKQYNLEIPSILGNCDLCFMKGKNAIIAILREYPELADKWIADENRSRELKQGKDKLGYTYLRNVRIEQLRNIAKNNLFKDYDLSEIQPAFDCACTA